MDRNNMSRLLASVSVGTAWEKLFMFLRASVASPASSSSSPLVAMDPEELRKLERTMRRIRATLHDAEAHWNIQEESTKLRLAEFKDLASEIEEVVREYEAVNNRRSSRVQDLKPLFTGKRKRQEETNAADTGLVQVPYELFCRAGKITERLKEITQFANHFSLSETDGERWISPNNISSSNSWHTGSLMSEERIVGRDEEKDLLVEKLLLLSEEGRNGGVTNNNVSVMAIVGVEGLGKTTLARLVYNDPRTRQSFDKHAWVHVSEHFRVDTITRDIINSLITNKAGSSSTCCGCGYTTELADLQEALADEMKDQRVLLVLDDVWTERADVWELLCAPMSYARVCHIVVTTRSEEVARLVQTTPSHHRPRRLSFDESWALFRQTAFPSEDRVADVPENLVESVKNIIKKHYKGLPLPVKTLGIMLRDTDETRWEDVLEHVLCDLEQASHCCEVL